MAAPTSRREDAHPTSRLRDARRHSPLLEELRDDVAIDPSRPDEVRLPARRPGGRDRLERYTTFRDPGALDPRVARWSILRLRWASPTSAPHPRPMATPGRRPTTSSSYHRTYTTLLRSSGETLAARARAGTPRDGLEPARAGRVRRHRPRGAHLRLPPPAGRRLHRATRRPRAGGGAVRARRHAASSRLGAARGAGEAAALVRRRRGHARGPARERLRPRRPRPDARRLPDRVEQAAPAADRRAAASTPTPTPRRARARSAAPRRTGTRLRDALGRDARMPRCASAASTCASGCSAAARSATRA